MGLPWPTQIPFNNINIEAKDDNEILKEKDDTLPEILKEQTIMAMGQDGGNVSNPAIPHQMRTPNDQQYSVQIQNDEKMYIDPNELDFWLEKLDWISKSEEQIAYQLVLQNGTSKNHYSNCTMILLFFSYINHNFVILSLNQVLSRILLLLHLKNIFLI